MFISATDMAGRAPRGVVAHRNWQAALEAVWAGLEQGHGTVVVLGAAGTGKSLMLGVLSERLRAAGTPATLARRVDCGLAMDAAGTLLIDEADALGDAALDCVAARAGGCVIAGLPSFGGRLARFLHPARLRPVRVVELQAVADDEVGAFAQSVLLRRGRWDGTISAAAARALAEASGGVARLIDALSTCAEYVASLEHAPRIEARHVDEAIALGVGGWAVTAPAHGRDPLDTVSGTPASTASTRALVPDGPELMSHAGDFVDAPISLGTVALIERARQSRRDSMNKAGTERDAIAWRGPVLASLVAAAVAAVAITAVLREGLPGPGNWQRVATIGDAAVQVARARPPGATTPPSEAALAQATPTPAIPLPAARSPSSRGEAPQGPAGSKPAEATPARPVVSLPTLPVPKPATAPAPLAAELPVEAAPATPSQPASVAAVPVEAVQVESPPVGTALARAIPVRSIPAKSIPAKSIPAGADPVEAVAVGTVAVGPASAEPSAREADALPPPTPLAAQPAGGMAATPEAPSIVRSASISALPPVLPASISPVPVPLAGPDRASPLPARPRAAPAAPVRTAAAENQAAQPRLVPPASMRAVAIAAAPMPPVATAAAPEAVASRATATVVVATNGMVEPGVPPADPARVAAGQADIAQANVAQAIAAQAGTGPIGNGVALARIVLRYPKGDMAAARRAGQLADLFRSQRMPAAAEPVAGERRAAAGVTYFFAEDSRTAESVAQSVGEFLGAPVGRTPVPSRWLLRPPAAGSAVLPRPGTIDVFVDSSKG